MTKLVLFSLLIFSLAQAAAWWLYNENNKEFASFMSSAVKTKAEILQIDRTSESERVFDNASKKYRNKTHTYFDTYLKYNIGNEELTQTVRSSFSPPYKKGQIATIFVDPVNSENIKLNKVTDIKSEIIFYRIVAFAIPAFFLFPFMVLVYCLNHTKAGELLKRHSERLTEIYNKQKAG